MKLWDNPRIQRGTIGRENPAMSAPGQQVTHWEWQASTEAGVLMVEPVVVLKGDQNCRPEPDLMRDFFRAAKFLVLDLASTIFFLVLYLLTHNALLSVVIGSALGVVQVAIQLIRQKPVHTMEWLSLFLIFAAGIATIMTDDPRFVLFKPSVIYVIVGIVMLKSGWLVRYLPAIAREVSSDVAVAVGYAWAAVMFISAAVNALLAITCSVRTWAMIMPVFGIVSKAAVFVGGFLAIRLTTIRRVRAMPADKREALLAATGVPIER